jgi:hypothetical protein
MVQLYAYVPITDTVAVALGSLTLLKVVVPGPDVCVHVPVPNPAGGVLPPSEADVRDPHTFCEGELTDAVAGVL